MHFGKKIGIIGGGQLGKMMISEANLLGFQTYVFSEEEGSPATIFANEVMVGDYGDEKKILEFASKCDFLTVEFESINYKILEKLPKQLFPNVSAIFISQNRLREKTFFKESGVNVAEFTKISNISDGKEFFQKHGKFILKTSENGYDGKGQFLINSINDLDACKVNFEKFEFIAEKFISFAFEASVILTRSNAGESVSYPVPINIHKEGILYKSIVQHEVEPWKQKMKEMAIKIANKLEFVGTMAVEFFVLENGEILANEMAPRPHNSGHFTIDLCTVSQFANHVRAVTGLPLLQSNLLFEGEMLNLIGNDVNLALNFLDKSNAKINIYGKKTVLEKRKMGHINFIYDEIFS
jgi:5-(carboxyamino)imidazole ribonucleotide synthase